MPRKLRVQYLGAIYHLMNRAGVGPHFLHTGNRTLTMGEMTSEQCPFD
jgi:hypothetical protein